MTAMATYTHKSQCCSFDSGKQVNLHHFLCKLTWKDLDISVTEDTV